MTDYVIYRKDSGEIATMLQIFDGEGMIDLQVQANVEAWGSEDHASIAGTGDPGRHFVQKINDELVVVERPALVVSLDKTTIEADGVDVATLTGLPNPCTILIDDDDVLTETTIIEVTGGGFTFSTEDPGDYTIEVRDRFPFLPFRAVITAS